MELFKKIEDLKKLSKSGKIDLNNEIDGDMAGTIKRSLLRFDVLQIPELAQLWVPQLTQP